jgi:hypothetical protein
MLCEILCEVVLLGKFIRHEHERIRDNRSGSACREPSPEPCKATLIPIYILATVDYSAIRDERVVFLKLCGPSLHL